MNTIDPVRLLSALDFPLHLSVTEETESTNDDLKAAAHSGAPDLSVRIATRQRVGRGREGRSFHSPEGLYMSVLLPSSGEAYPFLTHVAAIAVARAVKNVADAPALVKWVNDVFVDGRKIAGILAENVVVGSTRRVVLGIGVNANTPRDAFPPDLSEIAGTICCDATTLAAEILNELLTRIRRFSPEETRKEYRELCLLIGKKVLVQKENFEREATVIGLTDELGLTVRYEEGVTEDLISGEVHLVPKW